MTKSTRVARALACEVADRIPFVEFCIDTRCAAAVLGRETPIHNEPLWLDQMAAGEWESLLDREAADRVDLAREAGLDFIAVDLNAPRSTERPAKKGAHEWQWRGRTITYDPATMLVSETRPDAPPVAPEAMARRILAAESPVETRIDDSTFELVRRVLACRDALKLDLPVAMRTHGGMTVNEYLELIALFPAAAQRHFERESSRAIAWGTKAAALGVSILTAGGHLGASQTSMISPDHFRRFILPPLQRHIQMVHRAGAEICVATGGCIWPFADAFLVETGADGYWGIDTYAGMDLVRLRERYGGRICLIGGVDSVQTLTTATAAAVREETLRSLDLFRNCPGFMLASSNSIHNGVPPENFLAMIAAYREFSGL
ncbi:hypothetical protein HQ590_11715 [bacterium]|nr:hypothetical protein [bacterium]